IRGERRSMSTMTTKTTTAPDPVGDWPEPPFGARGPVSAQLLAALRRPASVASETLAGFADGVADAVARSADIAEDDDLQLALLVLHGLHYGGVVEADDAWEWHPATVAARVAIEEAFERQLREQLGESPLPEPQAEAVA